MTTPMTPQEVAHTFWEGDIPDWVACLANECATTSQVKVARRLGRSGSLVSAVLRKRYSGDMNAVEELVRSKLMGATVECPALGQIPTHECREWRMKAKDFSGHNSLRVQMYRACLRCPRNREVEK